jgi:death on curing protein
MQEVARRAVREYVGLEDHRDRVFASARPQASAFGDDAYPDLWTKAAALHLSVAKNHPLVDGNKRLGWLACAVFFDINGTDPTAASNDDVYDLVMHVAAHPIEIDELARRLRAAISADG